MHGHRLTCSHLGATGVDGTLDVSVLPPGTYHLFSGTVVDEPAGRTWTRGSLGLIHDHGSVALPGVAWLSMRE